MNMCWSQDFKGNSKENGFSKCKGMRTHIGGILTLPVTIKTHVEYDGLRRGSSRRSWSMDLIRHRRDGAYLGSGWINTPCA